MWKCFSDGGSIGRIDWFGASASSTKLVVMQAAGFLSLISAFPFLKPPFR